MWCPLPACGATHTQHLRLHVADGATTLVLQRLVLAAPKLAPPASAELPPLWPLGLFDRVAARVNLSDVRLVVGQGDFQAYLEAVQQQQPSAVQYHTVRGGDVREAVGKEGRHSCGTAAWAWETGCHRVPS
jgi:hypothetical protein